jgi:hypothetical protein
MNIRMKLKNQYQLTHNIFLCPQHMLSAEEKPLLQEFI